jgi:hypothetical protein
MGKDFVRFSSLSLAFLAISGCDNSSTLVLEPNPAVRVVIDASRCPQVQKCGQCQLDYDAYDKNSQPAPFPTLIWSSLNPAIATVNATGRVSGWATGGVTIVVEVLETAASDSVSLPVVPPFGPVTCTPPGALGVPAPSR